MSKMYAELVKRQDRWDLYAKDGSKIGSSAPNPMNKLSFKNCEAIERGYDLMGLTKETEWQVEIVMDVCGDKVYAVPEPVLDADGCLILKKYNMIQKAVHWLEQILKQSCGKEFTEGYKQIFDKAKQMEEDSARKIAYTAYCAAQWHDMDASESKFDKLFKENYD